MQHEARHQPDYGIVRVTFDQPGEQIITEAGAMVARDTAIRMQTNLQGGVRSAIKRRLALGESLFQNTFTATAPGQTLYFAPPAEGSVEVLELTAGQEVLLSSGAYLASTPGITVDAEWQGAKGFFGKGMVLLRAYGAGLLWFSCYGSPHVIDLGEAYASYVCDNAHMVAFTQGLSYKVEKLPGIKAALFSGEGLICRFQGHGRLWLQTRSPSSLAGFLHPFRRTGAGG